MNQFVLTSIRINQTIQKSLFEENFKVDEKQEDENLNWILFSKLNIKKTPVYKRVCNMYTKNGISCSAVIKKKDNMYYHCYTSSIHQQQTELDYIDKHHQKQGK